MDIDDARILEEAKAILKEITDPSPDPKKEQIKIWEAWFDRIANAGQPLEIAGEANAAGPFPLDLSSPEVPQKDTPAPKMVLIPL